MKVLLRETEVAIGTGDRERLTTLLKQLRDLCPNGAAFAAMASGSGFWIHASELQEFEADLATGSFDELETVRAEVVVSPPAEGLRGVNVSLRRTEDGWVGSGEAQSTDEGTGTRTLDHLRQLMIAFGGVPIEKLVSQEAKDAPRRVDRSHEPREWSDISLRRADFADLFTQLRAVMEAEDTRLLSKLIPAASMTRFGVSTTCCSMLTSRFGLKGARVR